jgi:uncharacterized membrane protein YqaE (UPF0057 family)
MAFEFFTYWVEDLWGSALLTLFGTGLIFAVICVMGRMSIVLMTTMLMLYFLTFGVGFYGMAFWLPIFLFSMAYFFLQTYKFVQKSD